jgi:hypothetical protein
MHTRTRGGALVAATAFALLLAASTAASAQDEGAASGGPRPQQPAARSEVNFEVQLHLLVTAEAAEGAARVPQSLDGVVRQLKASLPTADYRLAATFINRVRNGGTIEASNMGSAAPQAVTQGTPMPAFFQFNLAEVRADGGGAQGEGSIGVRQLRFGVRLPFQNTPGGVVQFQDTGINTQLNVREGEPALVGTLNTTRPGQFFVLVLTVRRVR